ncbi:uncharacterized protein BDV14DRAFT_171728 [Aspergillus stella-maris]|uniref:uncharacterized protein n=1 Tax=Aspergillus stella-maris TaxID=1810926 RepID=UPI003CCDBAF4
MPKKGNNASWGSANSHGPRTSCIVTQQVDIFCANRRENCQSLHLCRPKPNAHRRYRGFERCSTCPHRMLLSVTVCLCLHSGHPNDE